ncbi:RNA polymerase subunit sigma-24 [Kitasatospora sp. MMS16-BH015]|uniref:SigE family RNA polymerase sigma factor n=1 Tax=Kitasatospora sp. MMS16-BH015 TaxID=2018025 RepID=UPI000CA0EC17|nr:SigE family RNA polymerase sigma factor [Kitasatospora sp. MMS16-BH015]AUG76999.1 RNA polymerase subunit sigma-24 [Kitasatospora sp. MMS16-BH015]
MVTARRRAAAEEEFAAFAAARSGQLYRSAYFLTGGDAHLAEDLVQDTLARMYAQWHRLHRPGWAGGIENAAGYAQTVLVRAFLTHQRRRSSTERPSQVLPEPPPREQDQTLRLVLVDALAELPPRDRAVVVLRYWEDRSVEETAAIVKDSSAAVRSRCTRALARLRAQLGSELAELVRS